MEAEIEEAVMGMAAIEEWDKMSERELGLMLWALFRYFAIRAGGEAAAVEKLTGK